MAWPLSEKQEELGERARRQSHLHHMQEAQGLGPLPSLTPPIPIITNLAIPQVHAAWLPTEVTTRIAAHNQQVVSHNNNGGLLPAQHRGGLAHGPAVTVQPAAVAGRVEAAVLAPMLR
jgi:hypothetical protein